MVTITNDQLATKENPLAEFDTDVLTSISLTEKILATNTQDNTNQLLLPNKFVSHSPKAGLNPLVDAAAYLFSIMGKLKLLKSYRHISKLRKDLIQEITHFQDAAKSHGYSSEYVLVSRYALCASFDDVILHTSWGTQGQWETQTLLAAFNQESINQDRFLVILERLVKDPHLYIDIMEFMYICLSLGFKGHSRTSEFNNNQLELITNALYKRIRAYRGDFSKILSPFPIKPTLSAQPSTKHMPAWLTALLTLGFCLTLFAGIRYALNLTSTQAYQDLTRMGNTANYESNQIPE